MQLDLVLVKFANRLELGLLGKLLEVSSSIPFLVIFWAHVSFGLYFLDRSVGQQLLIAIIMALAMHFLISEAIIKKYLGRLIGGRTRPYLAHSGIRPLGKKFRDSSFPSSHMSSVVAIMTVLSLFYPTLIVSACLIALVLAFSRIRCGMHYPSDVLAGAVLGVIYGWAAFLLVR